MKIHPTRSDILRRVNFPYRLRKSSVITRRRGRKRITEGLKGEGSPLVARIFQ